jgi:hypothetical protein
VHVPRVPLGEIHDVRVGAWLDAHRVAVHRATRVKLLEAGSQRASAIVLADGSPRPFDFFVVAVPWRRVRDLFPADTLQVMPELEHVGAIPSAPIAALHLWFERPIMSLPHAVLMGRTGQWVFNHGELVGGMPPNAHYYQVVISAAHDVKLRPREELLAQVRRELEATWPAARDARLLHGRLVVEPAAVFALQPGVEPLRPPQATSLDNVMLAGDWTDTGWPATMESAVRSGYLAVEAILRAMGRSQAILVPDLPQSRLARWLLGPRR